jgi:uncharacterized protein
MWPNRTIFLLKNLDAGLVALGKSATFVAPMDKLFESRYSLNVARLSAGRHTDRFEIDDAFFEHFGNALVQGGNLVATLDIQTYETHLDVKMHFTGTIRLMCDRCNDPYDHALDMAHRVVYSFSQSMRFENQDEVIYTSRDESKLSLLQEFYDFIALEVPIRHVPAPQVHRCDPAVLRLLGLDEHGEPLPTIENENDFENIDPRWAALKKLK